jgi:hypothetical protein
MTEEREPYALVPAMQMALAPAMTIQAAIDHFNQIGRLVQQIMKPDLDYGVIPGTGDKPTLLKPGAEKLRIFFGLTHTFEIVRAIEDFDKPLFFYVVRCHLYRQGTEVGQGDGSCNSREKKYRYRQAERICPICHKPAIIKGKEEYGGGWVCYAKKGGCGAKFKDGDQGIEGQRLGVIENPDVADLANTILKQAEKRAFVGAVIVTVGASEFVTQDIEEWIETGYRDVTGQSAAPAPTESEAAPPRNGKPVPPVGPAGSGPTGSSSKAPSSPRELLAYVNLWAPVKYENATTEGALAHLGNAIRKVLGAEWNWPRPKDDAGWLAAADAAITYAKSKSDPRAEAVARINQLAAEFEALGEHVSFDPTWLAEASIDELLQHVKEAQANLDELRASKMKQGEMPV